MTACLPTDGLSNPQQLLVPWVPVEGRDAVAAVRLDHRRLEGVPSEGAGPPLPRGCSGRGWGVSLKSVLVIAGVWVGDALEALTPLLSPAATVLTVFLAYIFGRRQAEPTV